MCFDARNSYFGGTTTIENFYQIQFFFFFSSEKDSVNTKLALTVISSFAVLKNNLNQFIYLCGGVCVYLLSHIQTFATPWTITHQAPLSKGFSRQAYWNGLPFPSSGDLPNPETELASPASVGRFFTTEPSGKLSIFIF